MSSKLGPGVRNLGLEFETWSAPRVGNLVAPSSKLQVAVSRRVRNLPCRVRNFQLLGPAEFETSNPASFEFLGAKLRMEQHMRRLVRIFCCAAKPKVLALRIFSCAAKPTIPRAPAANILLRGEPYGSSAANILVRGETHYPSCTAANILLRGKP